MRIFPVILSAISLKSLSSIEVNRSDIFYFKKSVKVIINKNYGDRNINPGGVTSEAGKQKRRP